MNEIKSIIESVGSYLPPQTVTTSELLRGCVNEVNIPLERLTGIRTRRFAGESEFSIDLASKAVEDCLRHSHVEAKDFDLVVCANISRWDGPGYVGYEPTTAVTLKRMFGFEKAHTFDISNACASVWTAVYIADALIQAGAIKHAMVVSGEYISHLTRTAQKEIVDYLDQQIASLTLGDGGVAISMSTSPRPDVGFQEIDLYTLSCYGRFCIAKPTDKPHGGVAMHTDTVKVTAAVVPHAAAHAEHILRRSGQDVSDIHHIIPHQTSRMTMQGALNEISKRFQTECGDRMINNLEERGNTASTTHFLAMRDCIDNGRIHSGDKILFAISGSGQTTGTAIYNCDDLPDRIRRNGNGSNGVVATNGAARLDVGMTMAAPFRFESVALTTPAAGVKADTLTMLDDVAVQCLDQSTIRKEEIQLLMSVGVYRTEFLTEPALAALLAGDVKMNDRSEPDDEHKTLAFDLLNGSLGFLNACYLINEMGRAGRVERAMIVASEIENNAGIAGAQELGLKEMASAVILRESEDGETGFQAFQFDHYPEFHDKLRVVGNWASASGQACLEAQVAPDLMDSYLQCIERSVTSFLTAQRVGMDQIQLVLPPQISTDFVQRVGEQLKVDPSRVVNAADGNLNLSTSSTPAAMDRVLRERLASPGDLGLLINVGAGLQVACALYRF